MSMSDLILQAKSKKAHSVLFVVGSVPQMQNFEEWHSLRETPVLPSEWNILQQSILTAQQKNLLDTQGAVSGEGLFGGARVGFSFFQNNETMKACLDLELESEDSAQESQLPTIFLETALHKKGLILLTGQNEKALTHSLLQVLSRLNSEKNRAGVIFSSAPFPRLRENKSLFIYDVGSALEPDENLLAGVDLVVFHGHASEKSFLKALELAEKGLLVIYDMMAPSMFNALRRIYGFLEKNVGKHGATRLAEVLELIVGQAAMRGISQETVYAFEVLLMKSQVRDMIAAEQLPALEQLLRSSTENSGLTNLNQSLLQSLIRRRIDIKTAFEVTREPEDLDQLLKKVGI